MFVVHHYHSQDWHGYVMKRDGTVHLVSDPRHADSYQTRDDAQAGKVGHHRDMGGSGFKGNIISLRTATSNFKAHRRRMSAWRAI
jgi:hypothetical protein